MQICGNILGLNLCFCVLCTVLLQHCSTHHCSSGAAAARQQQRRGAKILAGTGGTLPWGGVGLMDTREIARIVATNTARIDLPIWLRSEPYWEVYAPSYLSKLCVPCSDTHLRSTTRRNFSIPRTHRHLANSAFAVVAPSSWNSLPDNVRDSDSYSSFLSRLKTHYFNIAFYNHIIC